MSLQTRLADLVTAVGTDIKLLRTYITGSSTGDLSSLTTTAKGSIILAINEVKAGATGSPPAATETTAGVAQVATQAEVNAGTIDTDMVTPLKLSVSDGLRNQPLNANLTALAALASQTAYGRGFLTLVNQAGLLALLPASSQTVVGIVRIATQTETNTGTDDATSVSPLKFQTRLAAYAQPLDADLTALAALAGQTTYGQAFLTLANQAALQALLGLDTDATLTANSDTKIATQKAVKAYADALIDANNAMQYKGVVDASTSPNYPAASAGWTYKISVAGKIGGASGPNVEVGDTIMCLTDSTASGTQAVVGANWDILQTNIDGAVVGPASAVTTDFATFSGTTGKIIADSGVKLSVDGTMASNVDTLIPSVKALLTYLAATFYTQTQLGNYDTDLAAAYATAKA